jgi:hypothetical protein
MSEQRTTARIQPFIVRCRLLTGGRPASAYVTDLSPRGARLALRGHAPAIGASVELEVRFKRETSPSRLRAEVKWVHPPDEKGWTAAGVRFVGVSGAEREQLEKVVEEFRGHASRLA